MTLKNQQLNKSLQSKESSPGADLLLERILEQLVQINDSIQEMAELIKLSVGHSKIDEVETDDDDDEAEPSPAPR